MCIHYCNTRRGVLLLGSGEAEQRLGLTTGVSLAYSAACQLSDAWPRMWDIRYCVEAFECCDGYTQYHSWNKPCLSVVCHNYVLMLYVIIMFYCVCMSWPATFQYVCMCVDL